MFEICNNFERKETMKEGKSFCWFQYLLRLNTAFYMTYIFEMCTCSFFCFIHVLVSKIVLFTRILVDHLKKWFRQKYLNAENSPISSYQFLTVSPLFSPYRFGGSLERRMSRRWFRTFGLICFSLNRVSCSIKLNQ